MAAAPLTPRSSSAAAPLTPRSSSAASWTGEHMAIWGGLGNCGDSAISGDGAAGDRMGMQGADARGRRAPTFFEGGQYIVQNQ
jgi:hypothetical protein